jgi:hypothetical protein
VTRAGRGESVLSRDDDGGQQTDQDCRIRSAEIGWPGALKNSWCAEANTVNASVPVSVPAPIRLRPFSASRYSAMTAWISPSTEAALVCSVWIRWATPRLEMTRLEMARAGGPNNATVPSTRLSTTAPRPASGISIRAASASRADRSMTKAARKPSRSPKWLCSTPFAQPASSVMARLVSPAGPLRASTRSVAVNSCSSRAGMALPRGDTVRSPFLETGARSIMGRRPY